MPVDADRLSLMLNRLAELAPSADREPVWPRESWEALRPAGALGWCIPAAYGGANLETVELLTGYEQLAGACLTTCFILSQRDAACRRIRDSGNEALAQRLLPPLARGERFATVGLSQLTTSRQHGKPAMVAVERGASLVLNGFMPWVTGAAQADYFITGAVLDDGRQLLAALPRNSRGVVVEEPLDLMALQGSITAAVRCEDVVLERQWLLTEPSEQQAPTGRGGPGGLETSCLALGLAGAAVDYLSREAQMRPELSGSAERLETARRLLRLAMHELAQGHGTPQAAMSLRARANSLVLRATQAALTASKGTGFLHSHPAQRWARQALFFLVWSCPRPAAAATLDYLTAPEGCA
jgi:alkylation response protein AidB-like acyl-CoA dehydrogenase